MKAAAELAPPGLGAHDKKKLDVPQDTAPTVLAQDGRLAAGQAPGEDQPLHRRWRELSEHHVASGLDSRLQPGVTVGPGAVDGGFRGGERDAHGFLATPRIAAPFFDGTSRSSAERPR